MARWLALLAALALCAFADLEPPRQPRQKIKVQVGTAREMEDSPQMIVASLIAAHQYLTRPIDVVVPEGVLRLSPDDALIGKSNLPYKEGDVSQNIYILPNGAAMIGPGATPDELRNFLTAWDEASLQFPPYKRPYQGYVVVEKVDDAETPVKSDL